MKINHMNNKWIIIGEREHNMLAHGSVCDSH